MCLRPSWVARKDHSSKRRGKNKHEATTEEISSKQAILQHVPCFKTEWRQALEEQAVHPTTVWQREKLSVQIEGRHQLVQIKLRPQESTYFKQQRAQSVGSPLHQGDTGKFWSLVHVCLRFLGLRSLQSRCLCSYPNPDPLPPIQLCIKICSLPPSRHLLPAGIPGCSSACGVIVSHLLCLDTVCVPTLSLPLNKDTYDCSLVYLDNPT